MSGVEVFSGEIETGKRGIAEADLEDILGSLGGLGIGQPEADILASPDEIGYDYQTMTSRILPYGATELKVGSTPDIVIVKDNTIRLNKIDYPFYGQELLVINVLFSRDKFNVTQLRQRFSELDGGNLSAFRAALHRVQRVINFEVPDSVEISGKTKGTSYRLREEVVIADLRPQARHLSLVEPEPAVLTEETSPAVVETKQPIIELEERAVVVEIGPRPVPKAARNRILQDQGLRLREALFTGKEVKTTELEVVHQMPVRQRLLADFILVKDGAKIPPGIDKRTARAALRELAGCDALCDLEAQRRFALVNEFVREEPPLLPIADQAESVEHPATGRFHRAGLLSAINYGEKKCLGLDTEMFFPERGASTKEAKQVCSECTSRDECLEGALARGEKFGIWGGKSERERRRIRYDRSKLAKAAAGKIIKKQAKLDSESEPDDSELAVLERELELTSA